MNITDPIADLLTRIRNGQKAGKDVISVPASGMKIGLVHLFREEGFVKNYKCIRDSKQGMIKIALKYRDDGQPVINELKRVSSPSRRVYKGSGDLPYVRNGYGVGFYSTSRGIMTDRQAREQKVGGEYICSIY